jgi:xylose dehydrogenase (NAD/NADP)
MTMVATEKSDKVRWGILSTARINRALVGPLHTSPRSELLAVASRDGERAKDYADANAIPRAFGSYEDLLADPEIDAVYISLPNHLHCEWSVAAAVAGKHVLCEKPLVLTPQEMDRVEAAGRAHGVTIFEAFMYLHHPQTLGLQKMVRSGELGQLQSIRSYFSFHLPHSGAANIRLQPEMGGGSLWDVGVYPVSFSVVMAGAGPPVEVSAVRRNGKSGVDIAFDGQMRFANDVVAQISCGFGRPLEWGATLAGSQRIVRIEAPWKPGAEGIESSVQAWGRAGEEGTLDFPAVNPYLCEVEAMEACVLDGADPVVPLSLSRQFLTTVLALYRSAETGQPVSLKST